MSPRKETNVGKWRSLFSSSVATGTGVGGTAVAVGTAVLVAGGWSLMLLGVSHLVFDVVGAPRLGFFLSVVGANAILAYLLSAYVDYGGIAEVLCGRALETGRMSEALIPLLALSLQWGLLYALWRRRIFLRV